MDSVSPAAIQFAKFPSVTLATSPSPQGKGEVSGAPFSVTFLGIRF
jgi:hypothetical protein